MIKDSQHYIPYDFNGLWFQSPIGSALGARIPVSKASSDEKRK
jgi:hypothetical protein